MFIDDPSQTQDSVVEDVELNDSIEEPEKDPEQDSLDSFTEEEVEG